MFMRGQDAVCKDASDDRRQPGERHVLAVRLRVVIQPSPELQQLGIVDDRVDRDASHDRVEPLDGFFLVAVVPIRVGLSRPDRVDRRHERAAIGVRRLACVPHGQDQFLKLRLAKLWLEVSDPSPERLPLSVEHTAVGVDAFKHTQQRDKCFVPDLAGRKSDVLGHVFAAIVVRAHHAECTEAQPERA
ncbi:MAG: hypothetical protein AAGF47_02790 [Planctomycetota bacterium]